MSSDGKGKMPPALVADNNDAPASAPPAFLAPETKAAEAAAAPAYTPLHEPPSYSTLTGEMVDTAAAPTTLAALTVSEDEARLAREAVAAYNDRNILHPGLLSQHSQLDWKLDQKTHGLTASIAEVDRELAKIPDDADHKYGRAKLERMRSKLMHKLTATTHELEGARANIERRILLSCGGDPAVAAIVYLLHHDAQQRYFEAKQATVDEYLQKFKSYGLTQYWPLSFAEREQISNGQDLDRERADLDSRILSTPGARYAFILDEDAKLRAREATQQSHAEGVEKLKEYGLAKYWPLTHAEPDVLRSGAELERERATMDAKLARWQTTPVAAH